MNRKTIAGIYAFNYIMQAIYCLLTPVALGVLVSWVLTKKANVGNWIYAVLIFAGVAIGLVSMIKYLIRMSEFEKAREKERDLHENQRRI